MADQQNKKKRARKEPFTIKFDSEVDFTTNFSKGRVRSYIFLHLRKRLHNSTLRAHTEELAAFWPLFFPWSSRIVSRANIDRKETVKSMQVFLIFVRLRSTEASFQSDAVVCSRINIVQQMLRN